MGKLEKIPAWQLTKVRTKREVIAEARNEGRKVHFASLMDVCHLLNSELEPQFQKHKKVESFRGDIVKDDSGSYAVFTEQGSSASQMTAAKVMEKYQDYQDAQSSRRSIRLNSGQKEDAPTLLKFQSQNVQNFGYIYQSTNGQNHGPVWKIQSFLLSEICTVILWQCCYEKGNLIKSY